jgi:hypothetical protein
MPIKPSILLLALSAVLVCSITGCSKEALQDEKKSVVLDIMTSGSWAVTQFVEDANDISSLFAEIKFTFYKNGTVTGNKGSYSVTGNWIADEVNLTITTTFSAGNEPYAKLNGTWKIVDAGLNFVKANALSTNATLYLNKN